MIGLLKEINFEPQKLVGVVEMRSRNIDITCKTRHDTLQLFEKLRQIDFVYYIRLYEFGNIHVFLIWVPLSNNKNENNNKRNFCQSL